MQQNSAPPVGISSNLCFHSIFLLVTTSSLVKFRGSSLLKYKYANNAQLLKGNSEIENCLFSKKFFNPIDESVCAIDKKYGKQS